jgi:hypothetical protein
MKAVSIPSRKMSSFLQFVTDDLGLKTPGAYRTLWECNQVYIGQTGHLIDTRLKEHLSRIWDKLAMVEHSFNLGHYIQLHHTTVLYIKRRYMDHIIREATEIAPSQQYEHGGWLLSKQVIGTSDLLPERS